MVFHYALKKIGWDYSVIKTSALVLLSWAFFELIFTVTVEGTYIDIRSISDYYIHLLGSLTFGLPWAYYLKNIYLKGLLPKSKPNQIFKFIPYTL